MDHYGWLSELQNVSPPGLARVQITCLAMVHRDSFEKTGGF
jgi:hypothetical protein